MPVKNARFVILENILKLKIGKTGYLSPYDIILGYDNGRYVVFVKKSAVFSPRPAVPEDYGQHGASFKVFSVKITRKSKTSYEMDFQDAHIKEKQAYDLTRGAFRKRDLIEIGALGGVSNDVVTQSTPGD